MDYTILYIIAIGLMIIGIGVLVTYLKKKYNISNNQVTEGVDVSKTVLMFAKMSLKDMKFGKDEDIDKVSNIIIESFDYIKDMSNTESKKDRILKAVTYATKTCQESGIEMNKDRIFILNNVITLSYNMIEAVENKEKNSIK